MQPFPDLNGLEFFPAQEGQQLEFKGSVENDCRKKIFPTICAFLNTRGGRMVFGVEDTKCRIIGLTCEGKRLDDTLLYIDQVYQFKAILDEDGNSPPVGQVTSRIVTLEDGRKLLVAEVLPQEGKTYHTTKDRTVWYRLSASNYKIQDSDLLPAQVEKLKKENAEMDTMLKQVRGMLSSTNGLLKTTTEQYENCRRQRDFAYDQVKKTTEQVKQLQGEFKAFAGAAKGMEARFTELTDALQKDILARKEEVEQELSQRPWWRCCFQ